MQRDDTLRAARGGHAQDLLSGRSGIRPNLDVRDRIDRGVTEPVFTREARMRAVPRWSRTARGWCAATAVATAVGLVPALHAQTDSLKSAISVSLAAGPAVAVGVVPGGQRVGYLAQGSLTRTWSTSPWRVRGDVVYQHLGDVGEHMRYAGDRTPGERGNAASAALAFASVGFAHRLTPNVLPYLLGGVGGGWIDEMRMTDGFAQGGGAARLAWQGGAGVEWVRGERALTLEARVQAARAAIGPRWYSTVPLLVGVRW